MMSILIAKLIWSLDKSRIANWLNVVPLNNSVLFCKSEKFQDSFASDAIYIFKKQQI